MTSVNHIIPGILVNDPPMSQEDLAAIQVLSHSEAKQQWDQLVDPRAEHLMKLPKDAWPIRLVAQKESRYCWHDDWNSNSVSTMQNLLGQIWPPSTKVNVFWNRLIAVRVIHEVLCRNWINFLYEDEGVVIRSESDERCAIISNSRIWISTENYALR